MGRLAHQKRLDEAALAHHIACVAIVGLRVANRVARDLAPQSIVIVVERQMPAVAHHGAAPFVGNDLQSETRQLERAYDFRPQETAHVGAIRIREVLIELAAYGGAADVGVALQNEHIKTRAGEIARRNESIVAGADDDDVMAAAVFHQSPYGRLSCEATQAGTLCVAPPACSVASMATSKAASVCVRHESSCAADTNHGSRESGSQRMRSSCSTLAVAS